MTSNTELCMQVKTLLLEAQKRSVQNANRHNGELLANMSHELRTPLNTIIGFAELMHDDKVGAVSATHKEYLADILRSAQEVVRVINDVHQDMFQVEMEEAGIEILVAHIHRTVVEFQCRAAEDPKSTATVSAVRTGIEAMSGSSILIVDDYPANLKLAKVLLQRAGYDVLTAGNAEEALQVIASRVPGLVLTDIRLPGMDGLELTRRLKANPATASIVVLALTASTTKDDEARALAAGCDGYISKPVSSSMLSKRIAEKWPQAPNAGGGR